MSNPSDFGFQTPARLPNTLRVEDRGKIFPLANLKCITTNMSRGKRTAGEKARMVLSGDLKFLDGTDAGCRVVAKYISEESKRLQEVRLAVLGKLFSII